MSDVIVKKLNKDDFIKNSRFNIINFEVDETIEQDEDSRFTKVRVVIAHTGLNLNKSEFSKELLESMIPDLALVPIVGFIQADTANKMDYKGHEERYIVTTDGVSVEYLGRMYGIIPEENNARFEMITIDGIEREYLVCDGILMNMFSNAKEIFDRDTTKGQSMELVEDTFDGYYDMVNEKFVVTSAKFKALCILGDNNIPAMTGGLIEKTQFTKINMETFIKEVEYANKFTQTEKGEKVLDIKLFEKLLKNYSSVSTEFAEEVKGKLDSYETEEDLKSVLEAENKTQFELTFKAQYDLLSNAVRELAQTDGYYSEAKYSARDVNFETGEVYVVDYSDWMDYGFTFTKDGDNFIVDEESKFQIAWQPVKLAEGSTPMFSVGEEGKVAYEKGLELVESTKEELKTEYDTTIETMKSEFETEKSELNAELERLTKFEKESLEKQKLDYVAKVENLDESEKEELVGKITEFTFVELEDEVVKIIGKKSLKFTANDAPIKDTISTHEEPKEKSHILDSVFGV